MQEETLIGVAAGPFVGFVAAVFAQVLVGAGVVVVVLVLGVVPGQYHVIAVSLVDFPLELLLHFVEKAHDVLEIRLDLLLYELTFVGGVLPSVLGSIVSLPHGQLLELVTLVQPMHVLKGLAQGRRHLLVEVLVMPFMFPGTIGNELICTCLFDVVIEPGQVEFIHAKADEVQK